MDNLKPNLFIAGFQRCGSTSLFSLLNQHPSIQGSNPKETFFLSDPDYEHFDFNYSVYNNDSSWKNFFDKNGTYKYLMEGSVCNFYQETAIQYFEHYPDAKIVLIVRDPIERFKSTFKYYWQRNLKSSLEDITIGEYYYLVKNRKVTKEPIKFAIEHGHYSRYVDQLINKCGHERLFIVGIKSIIDDPLRSINQLFTFLGLTTFDKMSSLKENQAEKLKYPKIYNFILNNSFGFGLGSSFLGKKVMKMVKRKKTYNPVIPNQIKKELVDEYKEEYRRFGDLF